MNIPYTPAKPVSYGGTRNYGDVRYIIIHYTGINNDTAENEVRYFANGNTRLAGAHFFVGQDGHICQSVKMKQIAHSVPRKRQGYSGGCSYLGQCTNANSVSIELCDNLSRDPSAAQTESVRQLVAYIQSICPYAKTIIRHYDVTGKLCPARMVDENKWQAFKAAITSKPAAQPKKQEVDEVTQEDWNRVQKMIDNSIKAALAGEGTTVSDWARDEYGDAVNAGITDGSRPLGYAKREEVAVMIMRAIKKMKGGG